MSIRTRALAVVLLLCMMRLNGCRTYSYVHPPPPPPTRDQIVGTWIGLNSSRGYRLDLFSDGTGALASTWFLDRGVVRRYETNWWELDGHGLSATFTPLDADRDPVYFRAKAHRDHALRDVSISLSEMVPIYSVDEFTRESRLKEWLSLLTPPDVDSGE